MESRVWPFQHVNSGLVDRICTLGLQQIAHVYSLKMQPKKWSWRHITHMTIMCMWLKVTRSAQNMGKSKAGLGKITRFNTWVEHIRLTRMIIRSCRLTLWWVLLYRFKILETKETTQEKKFKRPLEEALDHMIAQSLEPHLQVGQELCKTLI